MVTAVTLAAPMTIAAIEAILEGIPDPEIPVVSIRELGILRGLCWNAGSDGEPLLEVVITPTYNACPAIAQIQDDIVAALSQHGIACRINLQLAPAWTTDWITPAARAKLKAWGIAPPAPVGAQIVHFSRRPAAANGANSHVVPCPRCNSSNTTETSYFGATACKAQYRCLSCLEPFDYFKPY